MDSKPKTHVRAACAAALLLSIGALLALAAPAHASFPGYNGRIGFSSFQGIGSVYPDGGGLALLTRNMDDSLPSWSPDGTRFAFTRFGDEFTPDTAYIENADGSGLHTLGTNIDGPQFSPDASKFVFSYGGQIFTINADGTGRTALTPPGSSDSAGPWSPDGSKITFVRNADIYVMNPDGTGVTDLTPGASNSGATDWSPDGSKLVFVRRNSPGSFDLWVMNADGGNQTRVTFDGVSTLPVWSPDGTKFAYYSTADSFVHVMNVTGSDDKRIIRAPGGRWQSCASPCPPPLSPFDAPRAAGQFRVPFVPNFRQTISATQCQARGGKPSTHGAPLSLPSCNPPGYVPGTVAHLDPSGYNNANNLTVTVVPGDLTSSNGSQADVGIDIEVWGIFDQSGGSYDPNPTTGGTDVTLVFRLRISDTYNGGSGTDPATVSDFDYSLPMACTATVTAGSVCSAHVSANALTSGTFKEQKNTVVQVFRARLLDSGVNGVRGDSDDKIFAVQGIYVP